MGLRFADGHVAQKHVSQSSLHRYEIVKSVSYMETGEDFGTLCA